MTAPARTLLVSPPSAAPSAIPLLNLLYLAAALRRAGGEVRILDLDQPHSPPALEALQVAISSFDPAVLGFTVCSETALSSYRLLEELGPRPELLRVAGGPHATAVPSEPLEYGFDVVVRGEGEQTLVELARSVAGDTGLESVAGLRLPGGDTPPRPLLRELDTLAAPTDVLDLLPRPDGYGLAPTLLTSRGCPARCTFCANLVHGRKYRWHSIERVLEEMEAWHAFEPTTSFNFCDAAFTVHQRRLRELCAALERLSFQPSWWAEARADQLETETLEAMARAGCNTLLIGAESGDPDVLLRIQKGVDRECIEGALTRAREAGLRTEVTFMLGFPDETADELDHTLAFMEQIAPVVDIFRPIGIVMPYPGTPIYDEHHERLGYTRWWLDPARFDRLRAHMQALEPCTSLEGLVDMHAQAEEALLDVHMISYAPEVADAMQRCLAFRRAHNHRMLTGSERSA